MKITTGVTQNVLVVGSLILSVVFLMGTAQAHDPDDKGKTGIRHVPLICLHFPHLHFCKPPRSDGLVLYDDFNAKILDPARWFGEESLLSRPGVDPGIILESVRRIRGNRFMLAARGYGNTMSDFGTSFVASRLSFSDPNAVTAIEATVKVRRVEVAGCPPTMVNPAGNPGRVRIRLIGIFFSTHVFPDRPTPGSATDDLLAIISMERRSNFPEPPDILRLGARLFLCGDDNCLGGRNLASQNMGTVELGERVRLRVQWGGPGSGQFIFQRDDEPEVSLFYFVSDAALPGKPSKRLDVSPRPANCTVTPRPAAFAKAIFDNVFVNESAAP